jgi:hypothetical protein
MVGDQENILVELDYDNISLIDPNKVIDEQGNISDRLVKQENLVEGLAVNYQQPLPVAYRRLTKKPSQAKPEAQKQPQPLVLEEGEVEEN